MRRRLIWSAVALIVTLAAIAGLAWFEPWKLWIDHRVNEPLPAVALDDSPATDSTAPPAPHPRTASRTAAAGDVLLSRGTLITQEHSTSGRVAVVAHSDGTRLLAIADLNTTDGPDVHVWLTDAPVRRGESGWYVFDDGAHVDLGTLKGNLGNQVYKIPRRADLSRLTSVSLWCDRFDVSFGAAQLVPAS